MISEKDLILARREGYKACFEEINAHFSAYAFVVDLDSKLKVGGGIDRWVAEKYPLPQEWTPWPLDPRCVRETSKL